MARVAALATALVALGLHHPEVHKNTIQPFVEKHGHHAPELAQWYGSNYHKYKNRYFDGGKEDGEEHHRWYRRHGRHGKHHGGGGNHGRTSGGSGGQGNAVCNRNTDDSGNCEQKPILPVSEAIPGFNYDAQWPQLALQYGNDHISGAGNVGNTDASNGYTLHGLWPNCATPCGKWPQDCGSEADMSFDSSSGCGDNLFDQVLGTEENAALLAQMNQYWYSNRARPDCGDSKQLTANKWFWSHEWEKHGTCAMANSGKSREDAAAWFFQYTVNIVLNNADKISSLCPKGNCMLHVQTNPN